MQERTFVKSMKPYWLYGGAGFVVFAGITFLLNRLGLKPIYGGIAGYIGGYIGFYIAFGWRVWKSRMVHVGTKGIRQDVAHMGPEIVKWEFIREVKDRSTKFPYNDILIVHDGYANIEIPTKWFPFEEFTDAILQFSPNPSEIRTCVERVRDRKRASA